MGGNQPVGCEDREAFIAPSLTPSRVTLSLKHVSEGKFCVATPECSDPERTLPSSPHPGPYALLTRPYTRLHLAGGWGKSRELQCLCLCVGRVFLKLVLSMTLPTVCGKEQKAMPFSGAVLGAAAFQTSAPPRAPPPPVTGLTPAPGPLREVLTPGGKLLRVQGGPVSWTGGLGLYSSRSEVGLEVRQGEGPA